MPLTLKDSPLNSAFVVENLCKRTINYGSKSSPVWLYVA